LLHSATTTAIISTSYILPQLHVVVEFFYVENIVTLKPGLGVIDGNW